MQNIEYQIASIREVEQQWPRQPDAWLSESEQQRLDQLTHPQRRTEWLAARWLGKQLVQGRLELALSSIEIRSTDFQQRPCRPQAFVDSVLRPGNMSISHSADWVAVAISTAPAKRIGIDLVPQTLPSERSLNVWLTENERQLLADPDNGVSLSILWSVKEAVYKAVNQGEPFRPALWDVGLFNGGRYRCAAPSGNVVDCAIQVTTHADHTVALVTCLEAGCPQPTRATVRNFKR